MIYQYFYHGKDVPCIHTGLSPRSFAQSRLTALMHETGYRIKPDGSALPFTLDTTFCIVEHDCEWIVLPLPFDDGTPLTAHHNGMVAALPDSPVPLTKKAIEAAHRICRLFANLTIAVEKKTIPPAFLYAAAAAGEICFLSGQGGELLVLPPHLMMCCRNAHTECAAFYAAQVHPRGQEAAMKAVAFFLAAMLYRCLSGYQPFFTALTHSASGTRSNTPSSAEAVIQSIQASAFVPFKILCPASSTVLAYTLDAGLRLGAEAAAAEAECLHTNRPPHSAESIVQQLCSLGGENQFSVSDTAADLLEDDVPQADELQIYSSNSVRMFIQKQQRKHTCRYFFRKYIGKLAAAAAGIAVVCTVCVLVLMQWYAPPEHAGKPAEEVVRLFYAAINSLEHGQLSNYTQKSAGTLYEKPLLNLFFAATMRETFERKKPYYTPDEFLLLCKNSYANIPADSKKELLYQKGTAALKGGAVYGLSHLTITPVKETDTAACFTVSFYYWLPIFPEETATQLLNSTPEELAAYPLFPLHITFHRDTVYLTHIHDAWYINEIKIEQRQLEADTGEQLFDYFIEGKELPRYLQSEK